MHTDHHIIGNFLIALDSLLGFTGPYEKGGILAIDLYKVFSKGKASQG